jgi:flagellar L-ring protein precursor FlgH
MKRVSQRILLLVAFLLAGWISPSGAQDALPDSIEGVRLEESTSLRADWVSDRTPLRVGDILTVLVEEQTVARERVSRIASAGRGQKAKLSATLDAEVAVGASTVETGLNEDSRDVGEANRQGDLSGIVSVRVIALLPNGVAEIEGSKELKVDGRDQTITLRGYVRTQDVSAANIVFSSQIAEMKISYKGKKIQPRRGIIGRILSLLWP